MLCTMPFGRTTGSGEIDEALKEKFPGQSFRAALGALMVSIFDGFRVEAPSTTGCASPRESPFSLSPAH